MADILIVDDEKRMGSLLREELEEAGYDVHVEFTGAAALVRLQQHAYALVISDIRMAPPDGMEILRAVKQRSPETDVVMMTAYASMQTAMQAMKLGAYDYITKPFEPDALLHLVRRVMEKRRLADENVALRGRLAPQPDSQLVGESGAIQEVRRLIDLVAGQDVTVLVKGPSGSGKEIVAQEIHRRSTRARGPFVAVNCAAIPDTLLESELFGHEKGAFTGADALKKGQFELAHNGTLFLDEIGEMGPGVQAKLLRVLQEREILRIGGAKPIGVSVRVLAATNRNLEDAIRERQFREDLYYRLNVFPIDAPPLAARRDDVPRLAEHFLQVRRYAHPQLPPEAVQALRQYDWPGNVRELANVVERATILARGGPLSAAHFTVPRSAASASQITEDMDIPDAGIDLEKLEANLIRKALLKAGHNKSQAARLLGMTRRTLYSRMEKHGIQE